MGTNLSHYAYDPIGNRIKSRESTRIFEYESDELNRYTVIDGLNSLGNIPYDLDGNLLQIKGFTATWNGENRLGSLSKGTGRGIISLVFVYDSLGRKTAVRKLGSGLEANSSRFTFDRWNRIYEQGDSVKSYIWGLDIFQSHENSAGIGGLLSMSTVGHSEEYMYDGLGNVSEIFKARTGLWMTLRYGVFGTPLGEGNGNPSLSTKFYNENLGLFDFGLRHYAPTLGRWISRDPSGEPSGLNLLSFVYNSPRTHVDALGLKGECVCGPNVTRWFKYDLEKHESRLRRVTTGSGLANWGVATVEWKQQVKYLMAHKWMDFHYDGCGLGKCVNTVQLGGTCIRKNQLGNIAFGMAAQIWTPEPFYDTYGAIEKGYSLGSTHGGAYGEANFPGQVGRPRYDNLAAFGFGSLMGVQIRARGGLSSMTLDDFTKSLNKFFKTPNVINLYSELAGPAMASKLAPDSLTHIPEFGGYNTASCRECTTPGADDWFIPFSSIGYYQTMYHDTKSKFRSPPEFDAFLKNSYENYVIPQGWGIDDIRLGLGAVPPNAAYYRSR